MIIRSSFLTERGKRGIGVVIIRREEVTRMTRVWYENPKIILLIVLVVLSPGIAKIIISIVRAIF
jgi:hypothetical protein